jgi:hypothetical protein
MKYFDKDIEPESLSEDEQEERDEQEIESWENEYEANKSEN